MTLKIPNYVKYLMTNVVILFLFSVIFRVVFYQLFVSSDNIVSGELKKAVLLGLRFDLKLSILATFPIILLVLIANYQFFKKSLLRKIANFYWILAYLVITLFYFFDLGYYEYLAIRLDASALRFLSNLKISTQFLIESYPIYKGLLALVVLLFLVYKIESKIYDVFSKPENEYSKKGKIVIFVTSFLLFSYGIYNSVTHYPLRWSEAFFSKDNKVNHFGLNPILYFFDSFAFRSEGVDMEAFKKYYPVIAEELHLPEDRVQFERKVQFSDSYSKKPNVVFVLLESAGAASFSYYGNPLNTTPKMDSIIQNSLSFSQFYVHKPGTAASVFASITGLPDIDDVKTASRNPMIIDQRIIFDQYEGYEKLFFIGGSANWANIRGVFQSNIKNLNIYEEGSFGEEDRADVWGIDDYDLFLESDKVLKELHEQNKPFVAYIQTATNHKPFTVPDQKESYRPISESEISAEEIRAVGFPSIRYYNGIRYLDFNVNRFLERTKTSGYYENTIFVFFGDHSLIMDDFDFWNTTEKDLGIYLHHVPMFIHGPKFVQNQEIKGYGKLIDVFPTATSIAKIDYTNYTLGRNLLDSTYQESNAFIYTTLKGEKAVGLLKDGYYYKKAHGSKNSALFRLNDPSMADIKEKEVKLTQQLDSLLSAYYHSTKYLYFNNKKEE